MQEKTFLYEQPRISSNFCYIVLFFFLKKNHFSFLNLKFIIDFLVNFFKKRLTQQKEKKASR